ncbi:MAG: Rrf2 family transcriptional regulator [Planctomycetota bacterium]
MQLGKASAYAAFATIYVARHQLTGPVSGRRVAEACGIPPEYLLKILQQLARAEILRSETGRRGGFTLRKSADETTLLEIVEAIEGPLDGGLPVRKEVGGTDAARTQLEAMCSGITRYARTLLSKTTIAGLAAKEYQPTSTENPPPV